MEISWRGWVIYGANSSNIQDRETEGQRMDLRLGRIVTSMCAIDILCLRGGQTYRGADAWFGDMGLTKLLQRVHLENEWV